jgi:hypothetical protein
MGYLLCTPVDNDSFVFTSPTISCNSSTYLTWKPIVIALFIITVVLPPIFLVYYLFKNQVYTHTYIYIYAYHLTLLNTHPTS